MGTQKPIKQHYQIGDYVMKKTSAKHSFSSDIVYSPLKGRIVGTEVKVIKTKKSSVRRRVYDVIFETRSKTPEKGVWSHMLQRVES